MWQSKTLWLLAAVTLLGLGLRLYNVGNLPAILNRDEAALAYNAFLLKETGMDEWQRSWPLALESFGDYKLPGYPWLLILLFHFLPLSDWVVRLPSVIAGTALIPLMYAYGRQTQQSKRFSLVLAFLVALSPVFFFYSRVAYEANVALALLLAGLVLVLRKKSDWRLDLVAAGLFLAASLTYNTPLLLLPLLVLPVLWLRGIKQWRRWIVPVAAMLAVFASMMGLLSSLTAQKSGITIFSDEDVWNNWITYRQSLAPIWQKILGNRYVYYLSLVWTHFWQSFSPQFLVLQGGTHPWHSLPGFGHLFWSTFILFWIGLGRAVIEIRALIPNWQRWRPALMNLYFLLIGLIPSVVTVDAPHTTRSLFFLLISLWFVAYAIEFLVQKFQPKVVLSVVLLLIVLEASRYFWFYFTQFPQQQPALSKAGFEQVIRDVDEKYGDQPVTIIDDEGFHYILTAWYLRLPPEVYFSTVIRQLPDRIGFRYGEQLKNYHYIFHPRDRAPEEKVMVEWVESEWQVTTF